MFMMENDEIQKLVDLYWEGITTPEEETLIHAFYTSNKNLSPELEKWRNWFEAKEGISNVELTDDFDAKILSTINQARMKSSRWKRIVFTSVAVAAAVILAYFSWMRTDKLHLDSGEISYTEIEEAEYQMVKELLIFTSSQINRAEFVLDENLRKIDVVHEYINIK